MAGRFKKILVRSPNWIGDQILSFPFFYFLRQAFPDSEITVACTPWVESLQFRDRVDRVFPLEAPESDTLWSKWTALQRSALELRELGPWDLGICLPQSFSAALLMVCSRVSQRRGYRLDGRGLLLNDALPNPDFESMHRSEEYAHLLSGEVSFKRSVRDFWGIPAENPLDEGIPGILREFNPAQSWPDARPIDPVPGPYWVLAPGSMAHSRRWSDQAFAALARKIAEETSLSGLIVGGAAETPFAQRLIEDPSLRLQDWTHRGGAADYWKVFREARFSVCNDSGLAHVAALCGSQVHVIWGAGRVQKTRPLGPGRVKLSVNPVECWPCERNECLRESGPKLECLAGITPENVWKEIQSDFA